jgi:hypothetical protein
MRESIAFRGIVSQPDHRPLTSGAELAMTAPNQRTFFGCAEINLVGALSFYENQALWIDGTFNANRDGASALPVVVTQCSIEGS